MYRIMEPVDAGMSRPLPLFDFSFRNNQAAVFNQLLNWPVRSVFATAQSVHTQLLTEPTVTLLPAD
jgi:hypothetical protein